MPMFYSEGIIYKQSFLVVSHHCIRDDYPFEGFIKRQGSDGIVSLFHCGTQTLVIKLFQKEQLELHVLCVQHPITRLGHSL